MSIERQQGFTLIEMLMAIVIMGILLAVAAGTYGTMREKNRVQSAKEEVVSALQQSRLKALSSGESQVVTFDWATDTFSFTARASESKTYKRVDLQGFACSTSTLTSTGTDTMTFTRRGTVSFSGPQNIRVSSPNSIQMFTIKVNSVTGRIEVKDGGAC